jgi:hypothetical protein
MTHFYHFEPEPAETRSQRLRLAVISLVTLALASRLFRFVDVHAVNILFWDQWDYGTGLFEGAGPWTLFRWQHGPQREGLGYLVIQAVAALSGWDSRAEAFAQAGLLLVGACLALWLKRVLLGRWSWLHVFIPIAVLSGRSSSS